MNNVGWYLIGDKNTPSSRIMGINIHNWLNINNINSKILNIDNELNEDIQHIIFQKIFTDRAFLLLKRYKEKGIRSYYILDDLYLEGIRMSQNSDVTICGSEYILNWISKYTDSKLVVINDAYETELSLYKRNYESEHPKVIWFGTVLHYPQAEELRESIESLNYKYITITAHENATKQWNLETIWQDVIDTDIVVIPYIGKLPPYELAKGNNRLTQSMVLGMPVIASPIPSYLPIIRQNRNGFICYNNSTDDFKLYLNVLKNFKIRERIGKQARLDVIDRYNIEYVGQELLTFLEKG